LSEERTGLDVDRFRSKLQSSEQIREKEKAKQIVCAKESEEAKERIRGNDQQIHQTENEVGEVYFLF
jgi:hypothetical protein